MPTVATGSRSVTRSGCGSSSLRRPYSYSAGAVSTFVASGISPGAPHGTAPGATPACPVRREAPPSPPWSGLLQSHRASAWRRASRAAPARRVPTVAFRMRPTAPAPAATEAPTRARPSLWRRHPCRRRRRALPRRRRTSPPRRHRPSGRPLRPSHTSRLCREFRFCRRPMSHPTVRRSRGWRSWEPAGSTTGRPVAELSGRAGASKGSAQFAFRSQQYTCIPTHTR